MLQTTTIQASRAVATDVDDVRAAILTAREQELEFAVRATGHGTPAEPERGILLDTSEMARVLVDPVRRTATVGPGARWGEVIAAAAPYGLAPLAGSSPDVGVTGFTLGGGIGWLSRKHGFAADSVVRAELVTADGHDLTLTADEHPDLFWAIRGGGGNFGVVTSLEFRLYPVERVYAGTSLFSVDRATRTLAAYRDWIAEAPDELSTAVLVTVAPDTPDLPPSIRGRRVLALRVMYAGPAEEAERLLRPLRAEAGIALAEGMREIKFGRAAIGGTPPRHLELLRELSDPAIDAVVRATQDAESPVSTVEIRHWGGAIARPAPGAGPISHRQAPLSLIADAVDRDLVASVRRHAATGGSFLNFLHDSTRTASAYTAADYGRLAAIKREYDPDNFFRFGHNIPPAG